MRNSELAFGLIAPGVYRDEPPRSLARILLEEHSRFVVDYFEITFRPDLTPAFRRVFTDRLSYLSRHLASDVQASHPWPRREDAMIVVLITLRMVSPEAAQEWCRIFSQSIERTQEPGWLGGRCVRNTGDPLEVVVIEEWGSRAAFDAWYKSPPWIQLDQQGAHLFAEPLRFQVYEEV